MKCKNCDFEVREEEFTQEDEYFDEKEERIITIEDQVEWWFINGLCFTCNNKRVLKMMEQ